MIAAMLEKFSFGIAVIWLWQLQRVYAIMMLPASIDLVLGILFVAAFLRTPRQGYGPSKP
jgi:hypothetical protein